MVMRTMRKMMEPMARRVRLMIGRGVITMVNDATKEQTVQITLLNGEVLDGVERYQQYGLSTVPLARAEGIFVSFGGNRNHSVVIASGDRRYRLTGLEAGEVALHDDLGQKVHLKRDRTIEVETDTLLVKAATMVRMETPRIEVTGEVVDRCDTDGKSMEEMRTVHDIHVHPENDNGGPTDPPNQKIG